MFGRLGVWELAIILVIALIIFGPNKLPEMGKALGRGIREFKDATARLADDINNGDDGKKNGEKKDGVAEAKSGQAVAAAKTAGADGESSAPATAAGEEKNQTEA